MEDEDEDDRLAEEEEEARDEVVGEWLIEPAEEEDGLRDDRRVEGVFVEECDAMRALEEVCGVTDEEVGEAEDWPCMFMFWGTSRRPRLAMLLLRFGLRSFWAVARRARTVVVARMCLRYMVCN